MSDATTEPDGFAAFVARLRAEDDPEMQTLAHDMEYIGAAFDQVFMQPAPPWHNAGLTLVLDSFMPNAIDAANDKMIDHIVRGGGPEGIHEVVTRFWHSIARDMFIAGFIAGEGPEHIKKCHCAETKEN